MTRPRGPGGRPRATKRQWHPVPGYRWQNKMQRDQAGRIAVIRRYADGSDAFKEALAAKARVDQADAVIMFRDEAPDSFVCSLGFYALALGKRLVQAWEVHPRDYAAWIVSSAAPIFTGVCEAAAVELVQYMLAHDEHRLIYGSDRPDHWLEELRKCQSPIETRLLLHVLNQFSGEARVRAQVSVTTESGTFRVDIAVPELRVAVEADGHDFHERTKEQAANDRARDRALSLAGWTVLRFTGTEIWREAPRCAGEVQRLVIDRIESTAHVGVPPNP